MKIISTVQEFEDILKNNNKIVIDFFADWCQPCKMMAPIFEQVALENKDINFFKINVDELEDVAKKYGIMTIPTFIFFENAQIKKQKSGIMNKKVMEDFIK